MRGLPVISAVMILVALPAFARADDDFAKQLDLAPLRTISVQYNRTLQTLDTYARQAIYTINGHSTLDGHEPVYTLIDMICNPTVYADRNIIKITSVPLRQEFLLLQSIDSTEQQRIIKEGLVSLNFLRRQDVQDLLSKAQSESISKTNAINQIRDAGGTLNAICTGSIPDPSGELDEYGFLPAAIVPPLANTDTVWHRLGEFKHDTKLYAEYCPQGSGNQMLSQAYGDWGDLIAGWLHRDPAVVNKASSQLATLLPRWNPEIYPSLAKRKAEVIYNGLLRLTIPGAALYFTAFVLFLVGIYSGVHRLRRYALAAMIAGLAVHTTGILIRWWLVGSAFPPIKNEFESVMFSAWFGAIVGLILELRKGGMFGAAASFVGTLALVAIFAAPFVTGTQIGGEIAPVNGVLMSYWLYIHVTMVTAAYALIGMGFALSTWWLIQYYFGSSRDPEGIPLSSGSSGATLTAVAAPTRESLLVTLDKCNIVVLQLAFWVLGTGIVLGAIWADQSWGRPWGWDPKETFALVTWIVYLITVHARIAAKDNKAWWTAVLGFTGFWIMLFNWIGVNFFLVGLHSYA